MPPKRRFPEDKDLCSLPWCNIFEPPPPEIPSDEIASADQSLANEAAEAWFATLSWNGASPVIATEEALERRNPWGEEVWTHEATEELSSSVKSIAKKGWW